MCYTVCMQWKVKEHKSGVCAGAADVLERLFLLRGLVTEEEREEFLSPDYEHDVHDPFLFTAMDAAVARLVAARESGEKIGIYGDYDADGVCGATLLKSALDDLGFESEVYIPHKERDGHGLSDTAVAHFADSGVGLIVTVDCGITNIAQVADAKERGMDSIIIDHHHVPKELPAAVAVVNPKMPDSGYPFAELCGTGTAFKVVQALYTRLAPAKAESVKWLLDLVAIATVADCMPLTGENRTLVTYGLIVLGKTRRTGLQEMFAVGRIAVDAGNLPTAHTIGFQIAPRINAAGRMGHAQDAHALLMEDDPVQAHTRARHLEAMNNERRAVSEQVTRDAAARVRALDDIPAGIVVGDENFFHGVVGLAAGRLAERFKRPVGVFQHMAETSLGSFRSRSGIHVVEVLHAVNAALPGALIKYGGHAAAAGATIDRAQFDVFAQAFDVEVRKRIVQMGGVESDILVDAEICARDVTLTLAQQIKKFAPFGIGNDEPLFAVTDLVVDSLRMVGAGGKHVKFTFAAADDATVKIDGIGFSMAQKVASLTPGARVTVLARIQENIWQGQRSVQLMVEEIAAV